MRRCPQCNRFETDDALGFCRIDGTRLAVDTSEAEAATRVLSGSLPSESQATESLRRETGEAQNTTSSLATPPGASSQQLAQSRSPMSGGKLAVIIVAIVLAVALVPIIILSVAAYVAYRQASKPAVAIESIAVMPFVNESGIADVEYLSDGMTETLISSLSQLPNLNVKPRSSVFRYKGKDTNPQTIAKELNVQAILNGRVGQRGQELSLYVELIDVALDKVVWSHQYSRKQTDILTLQSEIARDVSSKLKSKLSGADEAKVTKTYTTNPEAYQLYLKGNFYFTKYTEEGCQKGIENYQKAIAIDANYALAYHGIAAAYDFANGWYLPPNEAMPKAKAAALKALELDDSLAGTHYLFGKIVFWYEWDWTTAEREWKRANELDPSYPAHYPPYLAAMGRFDEAINAQEVGLKRLPLDLNMNMDSASLFLSVARYEQSIEQSRKALELDPDFWWAYQT